MVRRIHQVVRYTKINIKCTIQISKNYKFWHTFVLKISDMTRFTVSFLWKSNEYQRD